MFKEEVKHMDVVKHDTFNCHSVKDELMSKMVDYSNLNNNNIKTEYSGDTEDIWGKDTSDKELINNLNDNEIDD
jgi:hypothetical protein